MTLATDLIAALTATFRADAQDLLTMVKELIRAFDAADDDTNFQVCDAIYLSVDVIKRDVQNASRMKRMKSIWTRRSNAT
jgi:hypothetical protein